MCLGFDNVKISLGIKEMIVTFTRTFQFHLYVCISITKHVIIEQTNLWHTTFIKGNTKTLTTKN